MTNPAVPVDETANENWIMFKGQFAIPALYATELMSRMLPLQDRYSQPLVVDHAGVALSILTPEQVMGIRVRSRLLEDEEAK